VDNMEPVGGALGAKTLSDQQLEIVVCPAKTVKVIAPPGSGKTAVLAQRAVYWMETLHIHPGDLTIITFTRAAARQIKQRIVTNLMMRKHAAMVGLPEARINVHYLVSVVNWTQIDDDPEVAARMASKLMKEANRKVGPAFIGTLHSWCADFLRKNAHFIGRPRNFVILDEYDDAELMKEHAKSFGEGKAQASYARYRDEINAMSYDDVLSTTMAVLKENPNIAKAYRFDRVLWDEYQDIGAEESELLEILQPEWLTLVGDPDQSIYGFRGTSPNYLKKFKTDATFHLDTNYRSNHDLILASQSVIQNNRPHEADVKPGGEWEAPNCGIFRSSFSNHDGVDIFTAVADMVEEMNENDRGLSSIGILTRTNFELKKVEAALKRKQIHYGFLSVHKEFWANRGTRLLMNMIRWLNNDRYDRFFDYALAEGVLPISKLDLAKAKTGAIRMEGTLWEVLKADPRMKPFRDLCDEDAPVDAHQLIEEIVKSLDLEGHYLKHMKVERARAVTEFVNLVGAWKALATQDETSPNLENFVKWLSEREESDELVNAHGPNSVTLATVHGSKGCEWDSVIMLPANEGAFPPARGELDEERRLFYVGMTRARDRVFFVSDEDKRESRFVGEAICNLDEIS